MDLDALRLKTASQLNDEEKTFLKENVGKLNDEDRDAYASFLTPDSDPTPADPSPDPDPVSDLAANPDPTPTPPSDPTPPTNPQSGYQFKTEEEARKFVEDTLQRAKKQELDKTKTPEERRYVEDTFMPNTWNEGFKMAVKFAKEEMRAEEEARVKQQGEMRKKAEEDWQALRKEHNLPDVSTDEGLKIHNQIVDIGIKHGKQTFADAYSLWSIIPEDKGGGYKIPVSDAAATLAAQKKQQVQKQKDAAAKLGGQGGGDKGGGGGAPLDTPDYKTLKSAKSARDLYKGLLNN